MPEASGLASCQLFPPSVEENARENGGRLGLTSCPTRSTAAGPAAMLNGWKVPCARGSPAAVPSRAVQAEPSRLW